MGNIQYYNDLSALMGAAAVFMLFLSVVIWIKLDVKRNISILSGTDARKNIDKIRKEAAAGKVQAEQRRKGEGSVISWNTSGNLDLQLVNDKTVPLAENAQPPVTPRSADEDATVLLSPNPDFIIEREEGTK